MASGVGVHGPPHGERLRESSFVRTLGPTPHRQCTLGTEYNRIILYGKRAAIHVRADSRSDAAEN